MARHSDDDEQGAIGCCKHFLRVCLVLTITVAVLCSTATLASCALFSTTGTTSKSLNDFYNSQMAAGGEQPSSSTAAIASATIGLLHWEPEGLGCRRNNGLTGYDLWYDTAVVCGIVAMSTGTCAALMIIVEFVCCRFPCSRFCAILLLTLAILGQLLTFSVYATDLCLSKHGPYSCGYESGSSFSIAASVLFLTAAVLSCPAPKARPLIRMVMEMESDEKNNDPCCYCWRNSDKKKPTNGNGNGDGNANAQDEGDVFVAANGEEPIVSPANMNDVEQQNARPNKDFQRNISQLPAIPNQLDSAGNSTIDEHYPTVVSAPAMYSFQQAPYQQSYMMPYPVMPMPMPMPMPMQQPPQRQQQSRNRSQYFHAQQDDMTSFSNAEVVEDDLFFDSKTV